MATERLACGHSEDIRPGLRLWCFYDTTFGVVTRVGSDSWHTFDTDGSPYKTAGNDAGLYDASRLACVPCGIREVDGRVRDPLVLTESWELVR